jgi:hypothetical protein
MTRSQAEMSVMQAVDFQLAQLAHRDRQEKDRLVLMLNRAVSTPPPTERDLALQRHIEERERAGTIHSTEWGD